MPEPTNPTQGEQKETETPQNPTTEPEAKPVTPEPEEKPEPASDDVSSMNLDALREKNPEVAKALSEADELRKQYDADSQKRDDADRKKKEEEGKWQELASDEQKKREDLEQRGKKTQEKLDKFSTTINTILAEVEQGISDDKKGLIPEDYSERQRLEYIMKNAEYLGATPLNKGGSVPKNGEDHPQDEEGQLQKEYQELNSKISARTATRIDENRLLEIGDKLKEVQSRKK